MDTQRLLSQVTKQIEAGEAEIESIQANVGKMKRLRDVLAAFEDGILTVETVPAKKRKNKYNAVEYRRVRDELERIPVGLTFTARQIADRAGVGIYTASVALSTLRAKGKLLIVGQEEFVPGMPKRNTYVKAVAS